MVCPECELLTRWYGQYCWINVTIANSSSRDTQYRRSGYVSPTICTYSLPATVIQLHTANPGVTGICVKNTCVGKCLGPIVKATQQFDTQTSVYKPYGTHSKATTKKNIEKVVRELVDVAKVFTFTPGRNHTIHVS